MERDTPRATCNGCPHLHYRGESLVRRDGISEHTRALEAGARDTEPVLRLYCSHSASVLAATAAGHHARRDFIVESVDGVDHVLDSSDSVLIVGFPGAVSIDETGDAPRPSWCRLAR